MLGKPEALGEAVTFLVGVTAVVYVYARHRDAVESIRQRQLRGRNDALEQLRTTLEERVAERTRALERKGVELGEAYAALQANQTALLQTEKMAAIGRLTAGFAHELASPLAAVLASADELSVLRDELARSIGDSSVTPDDLREIAGEMKEPIELTTLAATRAANFVRGIRAHTRISGPRDRQRFDAGGVVREALALIAHAARSGRVRVAFQPPAAAVELHGVPGRLSQAVINVVSNAIDAVGEAGGGNVEIELAALGSDVVIEVRDDGPGIATADLGRIFEPLFTTKPQGKGTGLGLAIVREIVHDEFRGRVEVESAPGEGARFVLCLPKPEAA
jgi:C4-dicarboxylate-specific signal transduction histidine kinase